MFYPNSRQWRLIARSEFLRKGDMLMSTYETLMVILATANLIVAILKYVSKK